MGKHQTGDNYYRDTERIISQTRGYIPSRISALCPPFTEKIGQEVKRPIFLLYALFFLYIRKGQEGRKVGFVFMVLFG